MEFLATALLVIGIFPISHPKHSKGFQDLAPLWLFLIIFNIGTALGYETGYAMNMARDFALRCLA